MKSPPETTNVGELRTSELPLSGQKGSTLVDRTKTDINAHSKFARRIGDDSGGITSGLVEGPVVHRAMRQGPGLPRSPSFRWVVVPGSRPRRARRSVESGT